MKQSRMKLLALGTALMLSIGMAHPTIGLAFSKSEGNDPIEIKVKVTQNGFLDQRGKPYGPKNPLKIPEGKLARITFVFSENMTSLAYGDTHQVAIMSKEKQWTKESEKIWMFNQTASVTFRTGKEGEKYRGYCIVDCLGMDHLNNLVIQVV